MNNTIEFQTIEFEKQINKSKVQIKMTHNEEKNKGLKIEIEIIDQRYNLKKEFNVGVETEIREIIKDKILEIIENSKTLDDIQCDVKPVSGDV
ncbi:hypothetical protein RclHR1_29490003 [Rhizophagus clarus]|uniref:Uncharacterized protein n=1 Tax=Rhizophagus clarus TaxID=94130 RepID=A0A2Z6RKL2_9GLOM|nr:hypothetical protein RclHR1_29490003 [Rhizophagus clarus]